jgi:hypothetical protein
MPDRGGTSKISSLFYILTPKKARKIWTFSLPRDTVKTLVCDGFADEQRQRLTTRPFTARSKK